MSLLLLLRGLRAAQESADFIGFQFLHILFLTSSALLHLDAESAATYLIHIGLLDRYVSEHMSGRDKVYDHIATTYDEKRTKPFWPISDHLTKRIVSSNLPDPPAHVLDAGAGTGIFSLYLLEQGYHVVLLDPSNSMLNEARRKIKDKSFSNNAAFTCGKLEKMDFHDSSFDFVFSDGDPLSYCIGTQGEAAREILRVLKPGSRFYISCDSRWTAVFMLTAWNQLDAAELCADTGKSIDPYGNPVHAFTPEELDDLFTSAGAKDVRVTGKVGLAHLVKPEIAKLMLGPDSPHRHKYVRYEEILSESPYASAFASHLQVTGRRPTIHE